MSRWDGTDLTTVVQGLSGPFGLVFGPGGDLYIATAYANAVVRWTGSGAALPVGGVDRPYALAYR